jgi:hypothetical protein
MFVVFSLAFISLWLKWSMPHFFIIVVLTLGTIISLVLLYNSSNKPFYYNGDILAIFTGYFFFLVEKTIAHSPFNDPFLCINISIGLSMIIIGLLNRKNPISIKDKFLFILKNKKKLFLFAFDMLFVLFTVDILLFLLGLGINVDTSSLTVFLYTFFPKLISVKIFLTLIFCSITKEFKIENVSLSLSSVILMVLFGTFNYYYIMPYVQNILSLILTKLDTLVTRICFLVENSSKGNDTQSLAEGIFYIVTNLPVVGRLLQSFMTITNNHYNIYSPFRLPYNGLIKNKIYFYPLTKISKFTTIHIATIIQNKVEFFSSYRGNDPNLELNLKKNYLYLTRLISNFISDYSKLTGEINLRCAYKQVIINTSLNKVNLEDYSLNKNNLNFAFKIDDKGVSYLDLLNSKLHINFPGDIFNLCGKSYKYYFFDYSENRTSELLRITDPIQNGNNLQLYMQQEFVDYNSYNPQEDLDTNPQEDMDTNPQKDMDSNPQEEMENNLEEFSQEDFVDYNAYNPQVDLDTNPQEEMETNPQEEMETNLQEFTQEDFVDYNRCNSQELEDSTVTLNNFSSNRGIERSLDTENNDSNESTGIDSSYSCIIAKVTKMEGKDLLYLTFDLSKLKTMPEDYLDEICIVGRTALFDHYNSIIEDSNVVKDIVDNFKLSQVLISEETGEEYKHFMYYLFEYKKDVLEANNIELSNLSPFSNLFLTGSQEYSEENIEFTDENLDLAETNTLIVLKEIKTRYMNFINSPSSKSTFSSVYFNEINIILRNGVVVDTTDNEESNFTVLLGELLYKHPDIFNYTGGRVKLSKAYVRTVYNKLTELIRKPLTKDDILFLINGLETRKEKFMEYRRTKDYTLRDCYLQDFNIRGEVLMFPIDSQTVDYEFLRLLENLRKEKPALLKKSVISVD